MYKVHEVYGAVYRSYAQNIIRIYTILVFDVLLSRIVTAKFTKCTALYFHPPKYFKNCKIVIRGSFQRMFF